MIRYDQVREVLWSRLESKKCFPHKSKAAPPTRKELMQIRCQRKHRLWGCM